MDSPEYWAERSQDFSGSSLIPASASMMAVATVAVILRFVSRRMTRVKFWWDDWIILAALPFAMFLCVSDISGVINTGFGHHIDTFETYDEVLMYLGFVWAFQIVYGIAIALPKFSLLAMYWRIFGFDSFKWPLIITTVLTALYMVAMVIAAIFTCVPVAGFWDRTIPATCFSQLDFYIGQAGVNISLDIILLIIPIIPVRRLNITFVQKIAVIGIFGLGVFVTICSAVRLDALITTLSNPVAAQDPSYYFVAAAVWSCVETCLSIVCACLPSMRPLLRAAFHGTFRTTNGGYGTSGSQRNGGLEGGNIGNNASTSAGSARGSSSSRIFGSMRHSTSAMNRASRWQKLNGVGNDNSSEAKARAERTAEMPMELTKIQSKVTTRQFAFDEDKEVSSRATSPSSPIQRAVLARQEGTDRVRWFLRVDKNEADQDNLTTNAPWRSDSRTENHRSSAPPSNGVAVRSDDYEISSERADTVEGRNSSLGYSFAVSAGEKNEW